MSKFLRYAAIGAAVASFGIASGAQAATTASADVKAKILSTLAVSIDPSQDTLDFGTIGDSGPISADVTLSVSAAGVKGTCPTGLTCAGTATVPLFHVSGANNKAVNITLPSTSSTLTYQGTAPVGFTANTMSVDSFVSNAVNGTSTNQLLLDSSGQGTFQVGGTLTVHQDQAPGTYKGTLSVSVAYN